MATYSKNRSGNWEVRVRRKGWPQQTATFPTKKKAEDSREAAALQSFPDDYIFHPTDQIEPIARMIGNAVPPKLARFFAGYLADTIDPAAGASFRR